LADHVDVTPAFAAYGRLHKRDRVASNGGAASARSGVMGDEQVRDRGIIEQVAELLTELDWFSEPVPAAPTLDESWAWNLPWEASIELCEERDHPGC
jgi:hypothetical protein